MAIIFYKAIQNLFTFSIHQGSSNILGNDPASGVWAVTVFSGVQPSAATITSTWTNYNTTFLAHWSSITLYIASPNSVTTSQIIQLSSAPSATTVAANSGTPSWGILWPTNPNEATISGSSLPSTQFIVVPVSILAGNGVIRFNSLTFTASSSYSITDINFTAAGGIA